MIIELSGRIPSKKNSKQIVCRGKYPKVLPSAKFAEWHDRAMEELEVSDTPKAMIEHCEIDMYIRFPDKRKADLTNKAESVMDLLVDYGILKDDAWQVVHTLRLFGDYSKEGAGVTVKIGGYGE